MATLTQKKLLELFVLPFPFKNTYSQWENQKGVFLWFSLEFPKVSYGCLKGFPFLPHMPCSYLHCRVPQLSCNNDYMVGSWTFHSRALSAWHCSKTLRMWFCSIQMCDLDGMTLKHACTKTRNAIRGTRSDTEFPTQLMLYGGARCLHH